jgi:hypothetical protein
MTRQTILRGVLVLLLVSLTAEAALANAISPVLYVPGLVLISPLVGLPATLAAAVLERPFVSLAGIQRHAIARSIRANLLSWLVGLPFSFFAVASPGEGALLFFAILAVLISIAIEGGYYLRVLERQGAVLRFRWVVAANVLSSALLIGLSFAPGILRSRYPRLEFVVEPHQPTLYWILAAISVALVAFALRPLGKGQPAVPEATEHGPGSECDTTEPSLTHAAVATPRGNDLAQTASLREEACQHVD